MNQIKSFLQLSEEKNKAVVVLYDTFQPLNKLHENSVNLLDDLSAKYNADHVILSTTIFDPKRNPLTSEQKKKHLERAFPKVNIVIPDKKKLSIIHHVKKLNELGYNHLYFISQNDQVKQIQEVLDQYNGQEYNFKKIVVTSFGKDNLEESYSQMREYAKINDYHTFKRNLPFKLQENDKYSRELFHDVRKGMGIHENVNRGMFKALFLVGGPGSGKDVIIREAVAERNAVEIPSSKAFDLLMDKKKLSEDTKDYQLNAIKNRSALVINGASDDKEKITAIKEELEELGYKTMMVFVNTTNEVSENRNKQHSRVISEQIRYEKWKNSQDNLDYFYDLFEFFLEFDNSTNLQESNILIKEEKANELSDVSNEISVFFKTKVVTEAARDWLINRGKIDINEDAKSLFKDNLKKKHMLKNNNAPITQVIRKSGKIDDVRDGDVASNSDYIFKTYEQSQPTLKINPEPKVRAFDTDKETKKSKKEPMNSTLRGKVINTPGVGDQYDTRTSGSVYPMSGLGDVTYRESFNKFRSKIKESIDDPGSTDIGMYGGMGNAVNMEPMQTPAQKFVTSGPVVKKKKINKQSNTGSNVELNPTSKDIQEKK